MTVSASEAAPPQGANPLLGAWTKVRTVPKRAKKTLHELVREKGIPDA